MRAGTSRPGRRAGARCSRLGPSKSRITVSIADRLTPDRRRGGHPKGPRQRRVRRRRRRHGEASWSAQHASAFGERSTASPDGQQPVWGPTPLDEEGRGRRRGLSSFSLTNPPVGSEAPCLRRLREVGSEPAHTSRSDSGLMGARVRAPAACEHVQRGTRTGMDCPQESARSELARPRRSGMIWNALTRESPPACAWTRLSKTQEGDRLAMSKTSVRRVTDDRVARYRWRGIVSTQFAGRNFRS